MLARVQAVILLLTMLFSFRDCSALTSRHCLRWIKNMKQLKAAKGGPKWMSKWIEHDANGCAPAPCQLEIPDSGFLDRMGPECRGTMLTFRAAGRDRYLENACSPEMSQIPTATIVLQSPGTLGFAVCPVLKAGSTALRLLMHTLIREPEDETYEDELQWHWTYWQKYTPIWSYSKDGVPADKYPSFIIGRNPYVRLLSGYLDKMARTQNQLDHGTKAHVNQHLQFRNDYEWRAETDGPHGFHYFVKKLRERGLSWINNHMALQKTLCGSTAHEYKLRLEDIAKWLPCMEDSLQLRNVTAQGWSRASKLAYVGWKEGTKGKDDSCWWKPQGMTCKEYYRLAYPGWAGDDFRHLMARKFKAVPVDEAAEAARSKQDPHEVGAASKTAAFYTQEIADIVYNLYSEDFHYFGYKKDSFS